MKLRDRRLREQLSRRKVRPGRLRALQGDIIAFNRRIAARLRREHYRGT